MTPSEVRQAVRARARRGRSRPAADVAEVARRLQSVHGTPHIPQREPLDELIHTVLSQSTTDANRDRAWGALRDRWPEWDDVRKASRSELEATIRVAGLASQKARTIQEILERLHRERGAADLSHLRGLSPEAALAWLCGLRGVGVKTAACVLCFSLRLPVLPVDTHVHRVATRLGWVQRGTPATRAHDVLQQAVPPELRYALHVRLIAHGRSVCTARAPACPSCPLHDACPRIGVVEA